MKKPKRKNIFIKKNFIETEAEEDIKHNKDNSTKNINSIEENKKISDITEDSYGSIIIEDEKNLEKETIKHRKLFNKIHFKKYKKLKVKRKNVISNNSKEIRENNIHFDNKNSDKIMEDKDITEENSDLALLKSEYEKKKIEDFNRKNNTEFIKRINENERFISSNNIIIKDGSSKRKPNLSRPKLKLFKMKGDILNKKNEY